MLQSIHNIYKRKESRAKLHKLICQALADHKRCDTQFLHVFEKGEMIFVHINREDLEQYLLTESRWQRAKRWWSSIRKFLSTNHFKPIYRKYRVRRAKRWLKARGLLTQ